MKVHINPVYPWHCGSLSGYHDYTEYSTTNDKDVTCPNCLANKLLHDFGDYKPSFPRTKFADNNDVVAQVEHTWRESIEALDEAVEADKEEFTAMELMDVIHSAETALFILAEKHSVNLNDIKRQVIEKNRVRGYYK